MSRNRNLAPLVIVSVVLVGGIALAVYDRSHPASSPNRTSSQQTQTQPDPSQYPGAVALELVSARCHAVGVLPDPVCTPGARNPDVTQATISQTICVSGYTKTIRPPVSYTNALKRSQMADYGYTDPLAKHEEDHLISLELGGAPSDPLNLWPEPHASPNAKDSVEIFLHSAICAGRISLADAQQRIATNWTTAEQGLTP